MDWFLSGLLVLSAIGMIIAQNPVHSCLCFLVTLLSLAAFYIQLSTEFIGVMQILVYAGAILVLFMFAIILFQDAHQKISEYKSQSSWLLIVCSAAVLLLCIGSLVYKLEIFPSASKEISPYYGTVASLGRDLYTQYFIPFEALVALFLVAIIGALYMGRRHI